MYWLTYRVKGKTAVVIRPEETAIAARLASLVSDATLEARQFQEAHALDARTKKRIPKTMIGRRLTERQARELLRKIGA